MPDSSIRKLAAIMFTDMVGYTTLMQKDEELALAKRTRHREVLQSFHKAHDGEIIQYFGDGTLSIFNSALEAVLCAIHIQRELQKPPKVDLRIGIHLGDIIVRPDGIVGDGVNIASRIESFSPPGGVMISKAVYQQLKNQAQLSFKVLGLFQLKNVQEPTQLVAITNEGISIPDATELEGDGSKIKSVVLSNLPRQLSSFLGRKKEIQEILELIRHHALVTLTGTGGTGKSRLAIRVGEQLADPYPDGICWIALADITQAESVGLQMAKALNLIQDPTISIAEILVNVLRHKEMLLILDNFEQVLSATPLIQELLDHCQGLNLLVTSRVALNLQGEQEYPVRPLDLPSLNGKNSAERLNRYTSVDLFCQRARSVQPRFTLNDQNAEDVARICLRLDGLPLAIELAAARIKIFSPHALLTRLDQHLDLLKADNPNRPQRHHTLRQTINWSYELLPGEEQQLFHRLSVFSGGCYLEAVESVCCNNGQDSYQVVDQIIALVNKSLLHQEDDPHGEPRFYMLKTIQAFATDTLNHQKEQEAIYEAHARYFVAKAEEAQPHLTGPEQAQWFSLLEADLDNFREAINWSIEHRQFVLAYRLGIALWRLWTVSGLLKEGMATAQRLLACEEDKDLALFRAKIVEALTVTYFYIGDYAIALPYAKENLAYWKKANDEKEIANNLNHVGFAAGNCGLTDESLAYTKKALELHQKMGDLRGQAVSYNNFGWIYLTAGLPAKALPVLKESLRLRKEIGDQRGIAFALINVSWAQHELGIYRKAETNAHEAISLLTKNKDKVVYAWGITNLGLTYYKQKKIAEADQLLIDAEDLIANLAIALGTVGWLRLFTGLMTAYHGIEQDADHIFMQSQASFLKMEGPYYIANGWYYQGQMAHLLGKDKRAWDYLRSSLKINHDFQIQLGIAENLELAGMLFVNAGEWQKAGLLLDRSKTMRMELSAPVPPVIRHEVDTAWSQLQAEYAPAKLTALYEKGNKLPIDELVSLILDED